MQNIKVHRYTHPSMTPYWQGYIEPDDMSWVLFIAADGSVMAFLDRDPETGAVLEDIADIPIQPCATKEQGHFF